MGLVSFVYTQTIMSGPGAALTAKMDKSNTVRTTNITMQSLKSILRLWKFIGSAKLFFLLKSQLLLVCFIILSPHFQFNFSCIFSLGTITKLKSIYKKREREHLKSNGGLDFKCIIWGANMFSAYPLSNFQAVYIILKLNI